MKQINVQVFIKIGDNEVSKTGTYSVANKKPLHGKPINNMMDKSATETRNKILNNLKAQ